MSIWSPGRIPPRPVCSRRPGAIPRGADIRRQREDITGARRMPWHRKPMKDAASCDNPRLGAHTLRPAGLRMGEPAGRGPGIPLGNTYLGGGQPGELKHLSTRRRRNQLRDPPSSGERKGAMAKPAGACARQRSRRRGCRAATPGGCRPRRAPIQGSRTAWDGRRHRVTAP